MPIIATSDAPRVIDITPEPESSVSVAPRDKATLTKDAQHWSAQVAALVIRSAEDCRQASYLLRSIKGVRADIQRWFAPHIDAAMETKRKAEAARKGLADECERMQAALVLAETKVKRELLVWEEAQERERLAEQARLQSEAQRVAEAQTLEAAAALEREATLTGDTEMQAEAEALLAQPIEAPAVEVRRAVPKVQGIVYRDNWRAHTDIDIKALAGAVAAGKAPVSFLTPNLSAINQWARATQGGQDIPGLKVINDRQIAARG
jgi:hypothetical protein